MKNKKILITGVTGMIGSRLALRLVKEGYDVTGMARNLEKASHMKKYGINLVRGELGDRNSLSRAVKNMDMIFHLASVIDPKLTHHYEDCKGVIFDGTRNIANACMESGVEKFIYFSSAAAIGIRDMKEPVTESIKCIPTKSYGIAKRHSEEFLLNCNEKNGFPVLIIRPPTIYGPGDKYNFLTLTQSIKNKLDNKKPFYFAGDGKNKTNFCYVDNIVEGAFVVGNKGKSGEIYHISDARPYTNKEVVETIAEAFGSKLEFRYVPKSLVYALSISMEPLKMMGMDTPFHIKKFVDITANFAYDISKVRGIGYSPKDTFKENIKKTVEWYSDSGLV